MMAADDEPERIFQQAFRFHRAQRLLMESSPNDQRGALVYPICVLAAFTIELLLKCLADDPIAEWLKQDESDGQNDQVRPDLHALTDQQLQDIFKIGRDQADSHQLTERGSERHPRVLYIWFVTTAAGFGQHGRAAVPFLSASLGICRQWWPERS
jgi:hypothetical protein